MSNSTYDPSIAARHQIKELTPVLDNLKFTFTPDTSKLIHVIDQDPYVLWHLKDVEGQIKRLLENKLSEEDEKELKILHEQVLRSQGTLKSVDNISKLQNFRSTINRYGSFYPEEVKQFEDLSNQYKKHIASFQENPNLWKHTTDKDVHGSLKQLEESFNEIRQKVLSSSNSDEKRVKYPKLFFSPDEEVLSFEKASINELLSQIVLHASKFSYSEDGNHITGVYSTDNEHVKFHHPIDKSKFNNEELFQEVELKVKEAIKKLVDEGVETILNESTERHTWIRLQLSQVATTAIQVYWTHKVEHAIHNQGLAALREHHYKLVENILPLLRDNLPASENKVLQIIVAIAIQQTHIIDQLITNNVQNVKDYNWQRQLRGYWDESNKRVVFRQLAAEYPYGYHLVPASNIAVLSNNTWETISSGLSANLGVALLGPGGSGKTEIAKAMALRLGYESVVINVSDEHTQENFVNILQGALPTGTWVIFDEINRINQNVAENLSSAFASIFSALQAGQKETTLNGKTVHLNKFSAIIITLNPSYSRGFNVPESWRPYFRVAKVELPSHESILEYSLAQRGFDNASQLSKRLSKLFNDANANLKDFSLHIGVGPRKKDDLVRRALEIVQSNKEISQEEALAKTLVSYVTPALNAEQDKQFRELVKEHFGDIKHENLTAVYPEHAKAIKEAYGDKYSDKAIGKALQLYELSKIKRAAVVIGDEETVKTLVKILEPSLKDHKIEHVKSDTSNTGFEFFGGMKEASNDFEWVDGKLSNLLRELNFKEGQKYTWIVISKEVNPIWIENLNTVLDNNMLLCLASGERIRVSPNVFFVFSTPSINFASPATISRVGVLQVSKQDLE